MKIYTKTGDDGTTGLIGGQRVPKSDPIIEALGTIDELNCWIGLLKSRKQKVESRKLEGIQKDLQKMASEIAGGERGIINYELRIMQMENEIDKRQKKLPEVHGFILPSGPIHLARAVCRRAERKVVSLVTSHQSLAPIVKYLNRLSDYLFVLALDERTKK
jgi:cob(I)alamin adenosyltransferase